VSKQSASALLAGLVAELDPAAEDRRQMELGRAASWSQEPVGDVSQDIAPEAPAVVPNELIKAADAAFLQEPYTEPALPDEDLPPVQRQSASALLAGLKVEAPAKQPRASASALLAELQVATPAPEAKPLNISFGGPEASLATAVRGEPKKPVTTPEAADGSDVTFDAKGPAFQFTGTLVMDPASGAKQGLDGMVPVAPRGPMAAAVGQAEPVLNRRPRLVPSAGGQIVFDQSSPERFTQGVEEAFAAGILPQSNYEKIKANTAEIFKVVDDRRKLEEKAQADPKLLAVLQGLGRGGAITLGAVGGAKLLATGAGAAFLASGVGAPLAPAAAVVAGTAGAIGGGIAAGVGYDALYRQLGQHFEEYDNVMKSAELYPMHKAGGELAMAGLAIGTSVPQAVRGLQTAYQAGGLPQVARTAGAAGGLGAGTGVVAYPIDAVVRGEEMTPGGFATAAGTGALSGGFFINNRMARTPEVMRIFAKADAGSKLTAAEETIYRAAYGPLQAAVRRGQVDGQRLVDGRVEVPTTSVAGMMPAAGRARVQARYESPMRLPEGALQAARDYASRPRPVATPPSAATTAAPSVPRQAPVNVIPPGETIIPPPPMTPAMMTPDAFADAMATERGLDMDFNPEATEQLFGEHFRIVREAINNNQPVNAAALELYEMQVPYYVTDETTGLSQFDQASFDAWQGYVSGRGEEVKQDAAEAGAVELLAAIRELGGLPAPKSGGKRAVWKGELQSLYETSRGARDLGIKGAMGLFRKDAPDVDYLVIGLREKGFRVETEADLFELLDNRLRNGRDVFAYPTMAADQFAPVGGRMGRRAPRPAPGQMDLLGERDVEFTLAGQTDRSSLTPEEMAMAQRAAEEKAQADALQGDLFGESPRLEERPDLTLASPDPQAYFDFSNVPVSKQPAGAAAVQAAAQANDTPYQAAPVSAAGGVAGDVGLADARARQAAAYRALLGGDAAAVAEAIKNGVPLSRLMLGYISREPASFNIRGAIIKSPKDLALYNLAHRTPFFESLKIAVLDDREQVIHSQVVSVGTLNEALAHPRDFAAVVLAAKEANPQAKVIGFMIMHNHPSGDPSPSDADRAITRRFSEVGDLIGVPLLDHVITNGESYVSFMEGGMLSVPKPVKLARSDARPRLPVLPAPEGQIAPGQMAAFEAVPASEAVGPRVRDSERVKMVHETLQTADPNMIHVINVDTRYGILSVMRHPMDVKPADIIKATSPAGAHAMVVSLPAMPQNEARYLMLRLQTAASLMQITLLDAAMVGMDQSFKQQKILETPEAPYGSADIGPISSDPLTVPPQFKSAGGGARVPTGTPAGSAPAAGVPDWVLQPGETSEGRRLIKGIENFKPGQRWGYRTIVDFVNKAVNVEIRYSRSQTSATHPANYKPAHHMGFSRDSQSQIVFHEAGHGLEELLRSQSALGGAKLDTFATELIGLTQRPGSMASDPPASASAAEKKEYQIGEGIAEWTRLLMVDPSAVQGLKFTAAVDAMTAAAYPKLAKALRDGARAVNAFQEKPAALRLMMFDAMPNANPSANEVIGGLIRMGEGFINSLSSGSRISKLDRTIFRAIRKQRDQVGMTYQQALDRSRQVRAKYTDPLLQAYNMILSIGQETQLAISGKGASKGLRVVGSDGKFNYFTRQAWVDLRNKIPASKVTEFDNAAYALEALSRWKSRGLEYKGMREGLTPDQLELIVAQARRDIPKFDELFAEQSAWFDAVVDLKDFGRLLKPGERDKILLTRDTYWPLPAATTAGRGRGGRGRGNITTGLFRAKGHSGPTRQVDEVAEERARTAFEAYYWNRFGLMLYKNMLKVSADRTLPIEARALAGAQMVQMKMPQAVAATVSREEVIPWVLEAIKDQMEAALGFRPELKADDINLSWNFKDVWRPTKPGDINVVSLLVDGERRYFQLGDPAVFGMFSNPQVASKAARFMSWALGPMTQNWKRNITQGPVFAIRNLFRDIFTQTVLNPDPIAWIPGGTHVLGTINKFTKKYPQVFQEGLLLSRVQPTEAELVNSVQHGAIWQWFSEGWYTSQAKDPVTKLLATVLQPSNLLFPFWKAADLMNLIGPGAAAGALVGGPVGGVVGAVVGPAIGFTGQGMAAFFETAGREGAAVSVLRRGGTDEEALLKYWTAAGQFNEHAGVADARVVMGIPGFLNPMFQGTRNALQKLSDPDPKVRGTAWTRMMVMIPLVFTTAAVAAYLSMQRKDRDRERQRPIEDRMNFMDHNGFAIPFPYGPEGVMATVVYNAVMDDLLGRPMKDAEKTSLMLIKRVFDLGSPLQFLGPQFAAINEANMNWSNFRQRPIVSPWMAKLSASDQYYSTTPEFYQKLGEMFNYSPAKLQYIMQQAISRQADEMVRLMESIDGGRPIQESADVPFVGRLFVRDPIGFGSQAVRDADAIESRLQLLSTRLQAKGYGTLGLFDQDGNPEYPADRLSPDLQKLQIQLQYLQGLRKGLRTMEEVQALAKAYATAEQWSEERNARTMMTDLTQSLLIGNRDRIKTIDQALELLKKIEPASPKQQAADYLERRF